MSEIQDTHPGIKLAFAFFSFVLWFPMNFGFTFAWNSIAKHFGLPEFTYWEVFWATFLIKNLTGGLIPERTWVRS